MTKDRRHDFESYFLEIYGPRWAKLREALIAPVQKYELKSPFGSDFANYTLDKASLLPTKNLSPETGQMIADLCASPGGKSLVSIFELKGQAEWFLNDLSAARVGRLKAIMHDCLPPQIFAHVRISQSDGSRWGLKFPQKFDRVLVDAPCSGERHLIATPKELSRWSLKGAKRLVIRQHALLCAGLDAVQVGGRVVYSTCSINPIENDGVIERLNKSRSGQFKILSVNEDLGEPTNYGWIILPDKAMCGPIYFAVLERLS